MKVSFFQSRIRLSGWYPQNTDRTKISFWALQPKATNSQRGNRAPIFIFAGGTCLAVLHGGTASAQIAAIRLQNTGAVAQDSGLPATSGTPLIVIGNNKTFVVGWTEYNIYTCKVVSTGKYTVTAAPQHGKLIFDVENFPLPPGSGFFGICSGVVVPFGVANYYWTDTNQTASIDNFSLLWTTPDGRYSDPSSWAAELTPRIIFAGKDVTGTKTTVATGQQVALTTSPTVSNIVSQSWKVDGTTVGGYQPSATACNASVPCPAPTDFTKSSTTFYWTAASAGLNVSYYFKRANGQSASASATFDVVGPTEVNVSITPGKVDVFPYNGSYYLEFGGVKGGKEVHGPPGMIFTAKASPPAGYSGTFSWVQIIESDTTKYISGSKVLTCTIGVSLDNQYPYSLYNPTDDSPNDALSNANDEVKEVLDAFQMYLLWKPNTLDSIPIALGYVQWSWNGDAVRNKLNGIWSLKSGSGGPSKLFVASNTYPQWDVVYTNNSKMSCK